MSKPSELYDQDFLLWTREQAAALRHAKSSNLPLDWENLAEEIEDLGKSRKLELSSQVRRILRHLLKLEASPASDPRAGWRTSIRDARAEIAELFDEESPSLRPELDAVLVRQAPMAARLAAGDLEEHGERPGAIQARLDAGGYTAEQVLGD
jgi:hypothetical protein